LIGGGSSLGGGGGAAGAASVVFGVALGLFEHSTYVTGRTVLQLDQLLAIYSDGITEAENPAGRPFDEQGLESALLANRGDSVSAIGAAIVHTVEQYTADTRLADDLTILLLRRCAVVPAPATGLDAVGV